MFQIKDWSRHPGIILFLFALFIIFVRVFLRGSLLELDEAEQVIMAQQLSAGYPDQPPLYTWLQYFFFQTLGCHLISLSLLKSILIFACLYCFHQISRLHCSSLGLAWCASFSWVLIPAISINLIKDNTHSILVLFAACLSWYWLIIPIQKIKTSWYLIFGFIMGLGLISKFNYLIFLSLLFLSALCIPEYRQRLVKPKIILSLFFSFLIASPYIFWLFHHSSLGFRSVYKLVPGNRPAWYGFIDLIIASFLFILPSFLIIKLFFNTSLAAPNNSRSSLLIRYHLIFLPFLICLILLTGIMHFEIRWLIPILFLSPLLLFERVKILSTSKKKMKLFIGFCLLLQLLFISSLVFRSHSGSKFYNQQAFNQIIESIKKEQKNIDYFISDSLWLLANLKFKFPMSKGWFLHPSLAPTLPQGRLLMIWQNETAPFWIEYFATLIPLNKIKYIENSANHKQIGAFIYAEH